jgi:RNA polymerase sigma factor (sigma-70 family)
LVVRLTKRQQRLVERHIDLALYVAGRTCRGLEEDERISEAYLGLCEAALKECVHANFEGFAAQRIRWRIKKAYRRNCRLFPRTIHVHRRVYPGDTFWHALESEHSTSIDDQIDGRSYLSLFDRLNVRQRTIIELHLDGKRWCHIAKQLGISLSTVNRCRLEIIEKLRA